MELFIDVIKDTLIDALKLIPFLFIAFLLMELVEHNLSKKMTDKITNTKFGPIVGSLLGAIPQCGFSVLASNLYVARIISLGTLISIYLSTSDEMLPILISSNANIKDILVIVLSKIIIGMISGIIIDLIYHPKFNKKDYHVCDEEKCDCDESIIKSSIIHTFKTLLYIVIITFALNLLFSYVNEDMIGKLFLKDNIFASFLSSLVGLIPNCAASVMITELYLKGVITMGTCIGGLLTGAGVGLLVLFKNNKNIKENINIMLIIYLIGSIIGMLMNVIGV